ncbi:hypothetical protein JCM10213v2_003724 [Rhodosporidiobolus nylandii]
MSTSSLSDQEKALDVQHEFASKRLDVPQFTAAEEKRLIRKIDLKARLDGLEADLGLTGNEYQICLLVFFVGYVVTETPSNMLLKRLRPSRVIPILMITWGTIMTLMGLAHNFAGLAAARFFLGLSESALFPGCCFLLASWYKRDESQLRIAIFFSAATLAGAFGGILAYCIGLMGGVGGKPGWFWIFALEGIATVLVGCVAVFMIDDFPEDAKFITEREREFVVARLAADSGTAGAAFDWKQVKRAFCDWRSYVYCLIYIGVTVPLYSLSLFVPTIISSLGTWTRPQSQLLSVPPYAAATLITLISALLSDRFKQRALVNMFFTTMIVVGFAIQMGINPKEHPGVAYFAIFLCVCGVAPCIANTITWTGNNMAPVQKRGVAMGMMFTVGNSGGIISSVIYRTQDSPRYFLGHGIGLGFAAMSLLLSTFMFFYLRAENARRDVKYGPVSDYAKEGQGESLSGLTSDPDVRRRLGLDGMSDAEIEALGNSHPLFRFFP